MFKPDCLEVFSPFGRTFLQHHPFGAENLQIEKTEGIRNSETLTSKTEKGIIRSVDGDVPCNEELYINGQTVVWSKGCSPETRTVIKSFTLDSDVIDCFWCKFTLPAPEQGICKVEESHNTLCVLENEFLNVFSTDGGVHTAALPFPVNNTWVVPGGLLLERTVMPSELTAHKREVPTLFSLMHPLDEPRPVASLAQGKRAFICDPTLNVIYTAEDSNFIMMYDSVMGLHSTWLLNKALPEDIPESPFTPHGVDFSSGAIGHNPTPVMLAVAHSRLSLATPPHSPFKQYTSSPAMRSHMHSPAPIKLMSPALGQISTSQSRSPFLESPFMIGCRSPSVFRSPPGGHSRDESFVDYFEPLTPEVCLKQIWQETPMPIRHGAKGKASKVIQTTDISGNTFLCYLIGHTNKLSTWFMKDRHSGLDMMLVLELDSSLSLFSGQTKACSITLSSLQLSPSFQKEDALSFGSLPQEIAIEATDSDKKPGMLQSIQSLRDHQPLGCNLVFPGGLLYKLSLPPLSKNSSVSQCITSIKCLLPAPIASRFILSFYSLANQRTDQSVWSMQTSPQGEMECFVSCLKSMMGYKSGEEGTEEEVQNMMQSDSPAAKKFKSEEGLNVEGDEAWEWLMNSSYHKIMQPSCIPFFPSVTKPKPRQEDADTKFEDKLDNTALLFNHIPTILFALHLVYEEMKLDVLAKDDLKILGELLCTLSRDLSWKPYSDLYYRDLPSLVSVGLSEPSPQIKNQLKALKLPEYISRDPPDIHQWLMSCLDGHMVSTRMYQLYSLFIPTKEGRCLDDPNQLYLRLPGQGIEKLSTDLTLKLTRCQTAAEKVVVFMAENDFTSKDLDRLPFGVGLPIREAIHMCSQKPPCELSHTAYTLIGREDLASLVGDQPKDIHTQHGPLNKVVLKEGEKDDGMDFNEEVMRLRFGKDLRVQEVRRLLQSARPVRVSLVQKPEVSDHEFIQEQEAKLLLMCKRTMALPVGRGMFTLATSRPVLTETLPIPSLDLSGRLPPRNTTVGLDHVDTPADMKVWPQFHNGVAAGLRIAPGISQIDSAWIVYNKPKDNQLTNEHAGFLMALGLNGHLTNLAHMNLHDYLSKGHELTTVGTLIGIAASKRGTMDLSTTKVLSIHVDALLPPTSAELDVPHSAQVAGVLGIGFVYQETAHRRMAEVLLSEIGRPAGPEMENAVNRESYSLSAGLALGLVMLQHGNEALGVADLKMADQLYHYMVGGQKKPQAGTQKEKFKTTSYLIKEGDTVNTDVTAPGATLALGLMYMKTNNSAIASWLSAPDTQFLLDSVRPDFLLLRLLSRGLIMWDSIVPSMEWVDTHIPAIVKNYAFCSNIEAQKLEKLDIDLQTLSQANANIIAGCCLAMGMRFAGSANQQAFDCLMHYIKYFKNLLSSSVVDQAGKPTIETCMDVSLLALSLVMAGTGNLDVLRIARQLRKRHSADVSYGSHMAIHMAIGLLFLGGGRYTLSSSGPAIAALVCALYPKFPISSTDNRYHLQAFRHLYVLAAEPRVIVTREFDSKGACYVPIDVTLKSTVHYPETVLSMASPCIIPELHLIKKISVVGPRYLPIDVDIEHSRHNHKTLLSKISTVLVKRRAGYLSYTDDPKGYRNLLARTFPEQSDKTEVIRSFSSEPQMVALAGLFCEKLSVSDKEKDMSAFIASILYECITEEKPNAIKLYLSMNKAVEDINHLDPIELWEVKLALTFYLQAFKRICQCTGSRLKPLLSLDFLTQCKVFVDNALDESIAKTSTSLLTCLTSRNHYQKFCAELAGFGVHHGLPLPYQLPKDLLHGVQSLPAIEGLTSCDVPLSVSSLVRLRTR
ncbi:anaphase-promoting complex subunit 1-like [Actinia tenebrosa]|uniref:Anaphase-promoting complex subunit 1-like n=1 Tax=Actinia tenebrosa TaxID=6105 RepID=A0A6P8J228_ACTTE|nr:anaphase-promoting complex subunit 1-like [Actinia tenebrosa]